MRSDTLRVVRAAGLQGDVEVPGDKSISHRAVLLGALAEGTTVIENFLTGEDCLSTISCLKSLGADITRRGTTVVVNGRGPAGLREPDDVMDVGNAGTAIRLLLGVTAGLGHYAVLTGDESIRRRPMGRVVEPLRLMGARITGRKGGSLAPLTVLPSGRLRGISYTSPIASAQVKSAILLAGLMSEGWTEVTEPRKSRDHTERMLSCFGAEVVQEGTTVSVAGGQGLRGTAVTVPGDISSAAFLLVAALILPGSRLTIRRVGLNPTRSGIMHVLDAMGGRVRVMAQRDEWEPVGDLQVEAAPLRGVEVGGDLIPTLIDEIPVLAAAAACAEGTTVIRDAAELRVKESDRIATVCEELAKFGVPAVPRPDGMEITGTADLKCPAEVNGHGDHRVAMSLVVLAAAALSRQTRAQEILVRQAGATATSFPGFAELLNQVGVVVEPA